MAYINYKNLSLPKLNSDPNHWADHIEFLCFISQDKYASEKQISDRILDENSNNATAAINDIADEDEIAELIEERPELGIKIRGFVDLRSDERNKIEEGKFKTALENIGIKANEIHPNPSFVSFKS